MSYNESLKSDSNYPLMSQSEWDNAPWNEETEEVEVTVFVSLEKTLKLQVPKGYERDDVEKAYQDTEFDFLTMVSKKGYVLEDVEITGWEELVEITDIARKLMESGIMMITTSI